MKTKIIILFMLLVSVGIAQQNKATGKEKSGKDNIELQRYPAPLTPISPEYPEAAKLAGIQGKVFVETVIDENGIVAEAKILKSEQKSLNAAAIEAIKKTKFSPGVNKENKNVKAKVVIPINFKLDEKKDSPGLGVSIDAPGDISDPDINAFQKVEKQPEMLESAKPEYPEEAKSKKITGKVFVKVLITKEGSPKKAVVIRSDSEILNQPAIDAAMKSKFSPALQNGKPIAVWVVLPFRFMLDGVKNDSGRDFFFVINADPKDENYPSDPIIKKIEGKVLIKISINEKDGTLTGKEIYKSDNELLNNSALKIIEKKWKESYSIFKKIIEQKKLTKESLPENAVLKSGSIICVLFKPDRSGK